MSLNVETSPESPDKTLLQLMPYLSFERPSAENPSESTQTYDLHNYELINRHPKPLSFYYRVIEN